MIEMEFYDGIDERWIAILGYLVYHQYGDLTSVIDLQITEMCLMIFCDHRQQDWSISLHSFRPIWDKVHAVMKELHLEHSLLSNIICFKIFSPLCTAFSDLNTKLGLLVSLDQGLDILKKWNLWCHIFFYSSMLFVEPGKITINFKIHSVLPYL